MLFLPPKHTALAACAGLIASITVTSTTLPASHAAEVGTCYTYAASGTKDQAASAPAVDCRTPHTAQTYWSGTLPANFSVPEKAKASSRLKATRACTSKKMNAFVNLENRELPTRFHSMPVFPTRVQWNAGERWVRCDVVFRSGKAYKKLSVPMAEFAAVTPKDQLNFCTPNVPGNRSTSAYPCTKVKKNWIMVLERDLGTPTKKFPGSRTVERQTKKICERAAKPYVTLKKYYPWWAIWPNSTGWSRADRTAQCFVPYSEFIKNTTNQ